MTLTLRDWLGATDCTGSVYTRAWHPGCDISESDEGYVYDIDLPGVPRADISVHVQEGFLSVRGSRAIGNKRTHSERPEGSFSRSFKLPNDALDEATAELKDGVLSITVPKKPTSKPKVVEVV